MASSSPSHLLLHTPLPLGANEQNICGMAKTRPWKGVTCEAAAILATLNYEPCAALSRAFCVLYFESLIVAATL